ncbi:hypothetical protein FOZ62_006654, partial [Perkinsus olseni]
EVVVVRMAMGEVDRKNSAERGEGEKLLRLIDGSDAVTADSTASAEDPQITGKLNDLSENLSSLVLNYTAAVNSLRKELYELCAEDSRIAERTSTSINSDALRAAAAMVEEDRLTALRNYVSSLSNPSARGQWAWACVYFHTTPQVNRVWEMSTTPRPVDEDSSSSSSSCDDGVNQEDYIKLRNMINKHIIDPLQQQETEEEHHLGPGQGGGSGSVRPTAVTYKNLISLLLPTAQEYHNMRKRKQAEGTADR